GVREALEELARRHPQPVGRPGAGRNEEVVHPPSLPQGDRTGDGPARGPSAPAEPKRSLGYACVALPQFGYQLGNESRDLTLRDGVTRLTRAYAAAVPGTRACRFSAHQAIPDES